MIILGGLRTRLKMAVVNKQTNLIPNISYAKIMPPKVSKINIDDLSEAILDSKIVESLAKALSPLITTSIEECLSTRLSAFFKQLDDIKRNYSSLVLLAAELTKEIGRASC